MRLCSLRTALAALFLIPASIAGLHAQLISTPHLPGLSAAAVNPSQPKPAATTVPRILVKFRQPLSDAIEAALPAKQMALSSGAALPLEVSTFMARYSVQKLAPLYADLVGAKRQRQVSAGQIAIELRARYPRRASRLRGNFAPPDLSRTYVLEIGGSRSDFINVLRAMQADPDLEYAEEDKIISVKLTPNDPYFTSSGTWGQDYYDLWGLYAINASSAWDTSTGAGIVVAVVDTGIDYNHPDIAANVVPGWDFVGTDVNNPQQSSDPIDHFGHGTHVAGTIAAVGNNGIGVIGVAWQAKVMPVKGLDDNGSGADSTLAPAIEYAATNGADVINNSWCGAGSSQTMADAVDFAHNLGLVIVACGGK